jgi:hypothetical protein
VIHDWNGIIGHFYSFNFCSWDFKFFIVSIFVKIVNKNICQNIEIFVKILNKNIEVKKRIKEYIRGERE